MIFLYKLVIFRFHVNFPGCITDYITGFGCPNQHMKHAHFWLGDRFGVRFRWESSASALAWTSALASSNAVSTAVSQCSAAACNGEQSNPRKGHWAAMSSPGARLDNEDVEETFFKQNYACMHGCIYNVL